MGDQVYPPAPELHEARCEFAPSGLVRVSAKAALDAYPYARVHCITRATVEAHRFCVVERATYEDHRFVRSSIWPADATGPLCMTCRGTHPESAIWALPHARPEDNARVSGIGRI